MKQFLRYHIEPEYFFSHVSILFVIDVYYILIDCKYTQYLFTFRKLYDFTFNRLMFTGAVHELEIRSQ